MVAGSKTAQATTRVVAVVWGSEAPDPAHAPATAAWLREVFGRLGAAVE